MKSLIACNDSQACLSPSIRNSPQKIDIALRQSILVT
jgi:hypothetical protein